MTKLNKQEIDSAIAALSVYGFSKALIKRTLKDILRVYNGKEGWPLIKENGYEVVVDRLILDDGQKKCKSQRKDGMPSKGVSEHDKENKANHPPSIADDGGGFIDRELVVDTARVPSLPATTTVNGLPPVALFSKESRSMLNEPPSEVENADIHLHQKSLWTRHGFLPTPPWLKALNVVETGVQQKFSHLCILLENLNEENTKEPEFLDKKSNKETANKNHCVSSLNVVIVKEERVEYTRECLKEGHTDVYGSKLVKHEEIECRGECAEESHASAQTHDIALFSQQESKSTTQRVADVVQTRQEEICNPVLQRVPESSISESQKLVGVSDTRHAETALHELSNAEMLETQKAAKVSHTPVTKTCYMNAQHSQQELNLESLKAQEFADLPHMQNDINCAPVDPTGMKQRRYTTWKGLKKREQPSSEKISKHVTTAQSKRPRMEPSIHRDSNVQTTFEAAERLDIARMSAFKLTRRKDGGTNPMFSRLQKLKQAGKVGTNAPQNNNHQERQACNASECGEAVPESLLTEPMIPEKQRYFDMPPGSSGFPDQIATLKSPELPPGFEESPDQIATLKYPELPPGFEESSVSSPDLPTLPPGFWDPCDRPELLDPVLDEGRDEDMGDVSSSYESPSLPPGFSEVYDPFSVQESPTLPLGLWEPNTPIGFLASPDRRASFNSPCQEAKESIGTPRKQVFIANIPSDHDGAVEQKLYSLVRELLKDFKSVPIDATLPRKILVTQDHGFVEFCCEAMAGIFMDAYRANASVMRIHGEQLLAARSLHLMRVDVQLRRAVAERIKGESIDPHNTFYLGNVPSEWQNEEKLSAHIFTLLEGETTLSSKTMSVYTISGFSDVYVHFSTSLLAETFFLRCLGDRKHLEKISASLFVCRNTSFLPRAARVKLGS